MSEPTAPAPAARRSQPLRDMVDARVYARALFDRDLAMLRAGLAEAVAAAALHRLAQLDDDIASDFAEAIDDVATFDPTGG